ncbi:MAG: DUF2807 domain-containing protein, partial [Ginsengibacter sp.]
MKLSITLLFTLFMGQLFAQVVINDKNVELRTVGVFSAIKVSSGIDVYLSQSDEYAVAVSASEVKFRDAIKTEVRDGILRITYDNDNVLHWENNRRLRAYISFKDLSALDASGAADITFTEKFSTNSFRLKLSGASEIKGNISCKDLDMELSGASTVRLAGNVDNI